MGIQRLCIMLNKQLNLIIAKVTEFCYISTHILRIYRKSSYRRLFLPVYNPLLRQSEYIAGN